MITPKSKILIATLFCLVFFTSLTNIPDSNAFLPLMGGTNIIQDSIQGFCNITNQTQTMHCSSSSTTLHFTHGKAMTVNLFPSNQTIFVNATGAIGPQGPQGPTGATGSQGAAGSQIYTGSGSPSAGFGINGDFYINVTTGDYYLKSGGSWVLKGNLIGPQGPIGPTGPSGRNGTNGTNGSNGRNGTNGTNGSNGTNGVNGTSSYFNSINCSTNQFINAYNNATHLASCAIPLNTAQITNADNGESLIGAKQNATNTSLKTLRNATAYVNFNHNSTSITPTFQFKINNISCPANSATISFNNSTGLSTCQAFGNATSINDLGDVVISGVSNGQILQYSSPSWKNITFKINTLSCPANQAFISFNNSTGILTCQAFGSGTITGSFNSGKATGSVGTLATAVSPNIKGRNMTGISPISITKTNDTDLSISCSTCLTSSSGVSQINTFTNKVNITAQTGNTTITNSSGTIKIGNGINDFIINGAVQTISKRFIASLLDAASFIVDATDNTKKLSFILSGSSTGTTLTQRTNQTTSQGINWPNIRETETIAIKPQINFSSSSNKTGTTSLTPVILGDGVSLTPQVTGRIEVSVTGYATTSVAADGGAVQISRFTGTCSSNGVANTGTLLGANVKMTAPATTSKVPFSLVIQTTGLIINQKYCFALTENAVTGGTFTPFNVVWFAKEL